MTLDGHLDGGDVTAQRISGPRVGRRGKVWKQVTLTPEQAEQIAREMAYRGLTFQELAETAFSSVIPQFPTEQAERKAS